MTIDERLEFLLKSTESLHETVQENTHQIGELTRKLDGLANTVSDLALIARDHHLQKRLC